MSNQCICLTCNGLSVDLEDPEPYLCMYDDHYADTLEELQVECFKKINGGIYNG